MTTYLRRIERPKIEDFKSFIIPEGRFPVHITKPDKKNKKDELEEGAYEVNRQDENEAEEVPVS